MSSISSPQRRRLPAIWRDYARFTALPSPEHRPIRLDRQWLRDFLALFALVWIGMLICLLAYGVTKLALGIEMPPRKVSAYSPALLAALMIVIAPFLEELVFRSWFPVVAWVRKFWSALGPLFPAAVWASTLIFALLHLANYRSMPSSIYGFAWVAPQLWAGTIFAFARVRLGFFGAFLLHATVNAVAFALIFAGRNLQDEYHCVPNKSGIIICTTESGRTKVFRPPSPVKQTVPK